MCNTIIFRYNAKIKRHIHKTKGNKIKTTKKKIVNTIKENENEPKKPDELKKITEKNRFGGYYKTKKRFIN
jgi:hypothetical protein